MKLRDMKNSIGLIFGLLVMTSWHNGQAQGGVGIGTPTVVDDAALQIVSPSDNQGLLIPSMTTTERTSGWATTSGIMVYDTILKAFYYYDGANWIRLIASPAKLNVNMNAHKITNLANGTNTGDAVNKGQLDAAITTVDNNNLDRDGTDTMTGNINMGNRKIINMFPGLSANEAVNLSQLTNVGNRIADVEYRTHNAGGSYPTVAQTSSLRAGGGTTYNMQTKIISNSTSKNKGYLCAAFFSLTGSGEAEDIGVALYKDTAMFASWRRWIREGSNNGEDLYTIMGSTSLGAGQSTTIRNEIKVFDDDIRFTARGMFCISDN